jgi:hypothetical protein
MPFAAVDLALKMCACLYRDTDVNVLPVELSKVSYVATNSCSLGAIFGLSDSNRSCSSHPPP